MYFIRTSPLDLLLWLVIFLLLWVGGWLLNLYLFRVRPRESLVAGLASGIVLFIVIANLLANITSLLPALWTSALAIFGVGVYSAWKYRRGQGLIRGSLRAWPELLALGLLLLLFTLINRGMAIFDDYHNLPLLSTMAAGDVPPHFYLNPDFKLSYHYGLHIFAASMLRIGGTYPWSALDISKALILATTVMLGWTWFRRETRSMTGGTTGTILMLFGGGTRWLLLFLPISMGSSLAAGIMLLGSAAASGSNLFSALVKPWNIEGAGSFPFPFAFSNGIFSTINLALGGSGALPIMTVILLLVIVQRRWKPFSTLLYSLVLASFALSSEHYFVMVWVGLVLALLAAKFWWHRMYRWRPWVIILSLSFIIAATSGGVLTEVARRSLAGLLGYTVVSGFGLTGFSLRWLPALQSAHLGSLSLINPRHLLIALIEAGPALILAPWVTWWGFKRSKKGNFAYAGLALGALSIFLVSLFTIYIERERDISRLPAAALITWLILGFPLLWYAWKKGRQITRILIACWYAIVIFGGVVILAIELIAMARPQFTYFVDEPDAMMARDYWGKLEPGTQVLDTAPYRAITVLGLGGGRAYQDFYSPLPKRASLSGTPNPGDIANAGYDYLYLDKETWQLMTPEGKSNLQQPCVVLIAEYVTESREYRRLLDISACRTDQ
jgi:hypothetical protein